MITLFSRICKLENIVLARQNIHTCSDTDAHINNTNINIVQLFFPKKIYLSKHYSMVYVILSYPASKCV